MKYLLILSCFLFTSVGWSKDVSYDDLVERDGLYYEKFTDVPFTGNVVGQIQLKIIKGKREGEYLIFYESGQLSGKGNFIDGKQEGQSFIYYESGELKNKANWIDGKLEGEALMYYKDGLILEKRNYKDGKQDGEQLIYWMNGDLDKTEIYKDDKLIKTIKH